MEVANKAKKAKKGIVASSMKTVPVKVIKKGFGTHKVGAVLQMHKTTAEGCIKSGAVERMVSGKTILNYG